jgi:hypothetical protein
MVADHIWMGVILANLMQLEKGLGIVRCITAPYLGPYLGTTAARLKVLDPAKNKRPSD